MKTYKHLFEEMVKEENIRQCFFDAAKRKTNRNDVAAVLKEERDEGDESPEPQCLQEHVKALQKILMEESYAPPQHRKVKINEYNCGKVREIIKPDYKYEQVVHHCIIKQLHPIVMRSLYEHALGSIPNRGAHSGKKQLEKWIARYGGKKFYVLKIDVRHCFETEDIQTIEEKLARIIKDDRFLRLCSKVLESEAEIKRKEMPDGTDGWEDEGRLAGIPLGFVTSQWFMQLNFCKLDHLIMEDWKQEFGVDKMIRYADDIVVLGRNKKKLHRLRERIDEYLKTEMHQHLKGNWQVFRFEYVDRKTGKVRGRAIDFMGFVFHHNRTTLRKSILRRSVRKAHKIGKKDKATWYDATAMLSYMGWYTHTDTYAFYEREIKPYVNVKKLKKIVSKHSKKGAKGNGKTVVHSGEHGEAGGIRQDIQPDNSLPAQGHP